MTMWFTSDTHFNHKNILHLSERPFADIETHDWALIDNWNDVVSPSDYVIHLGDVALGPWPVGIERVGHLNGHKILVPGNHDRISSVEKVARRERFMSDYSEVFQEIWDEVSLVHVQGVEFIVSHYPYVGDSHDGDRFTEIRPVDEMLPLIHGHTHCGPDEFITHSPSGTLQINVGVDAHDYRPVHEDTIIRIWEDSQ